MICVQTSASKNVKVNVDMDDQSDDSCDWIKDI